MSRREREERIHELLNQVQQQRLDLSAARRDWLYGTAHYDRGWLTFLSIRRYLAIGSSALAIWSVRSPNKLMRWAKRGFGLWSTWRMFKAALPQR
ncbi:MAG: YqjK-like family protein [Enterobacterales bacterium endosymbiont of Blomia tropicalis]|uniref:YqjK-like family protein n=1 Tax=Mixta mediterraneensis TaxID=2758443 RepID=UPI0018756F0C|nr:YqjK-like family protein [Mixta mediterraneensis]MBE5254119.1 YqjK-like family protein [Mixta mediterraneensis]MDL4915300.1 YqjK-like family protein [Mixta mediterraneensis]